MRYPLLLTLLASTGALLVAQTVPGPSIKWRGAVWASGAASDRQTTDDGLFLRGVDAGEGQIALDGLQFGADVTLAQGWSAKFTVLGGQSAKVLNATNAQETGSIAYPEAMLIWTGGHDTVKLGRMWTSLGMEVVDHTQDVTASRGLLYTYADPFAQVGINWHHAFTSSWSTDVWAFNGEDRVRDNNKGKTLGLGLTYNHAGAADKFASLMVYRGVEQASVNTGAEGRPRERACILGQWVWGASTLQWELEYGQESFAAEAIRGAAGQGDVKAAWSGLGAIYKLQLDERWALFARGEYLKDDKGVRLLADPSINGSLVNAAGTAFAGLLNANLKATSVALGLERKWAATFSRLEVRRDSLNKDVLSGVSDGFKSFRDATSLTWSFGTSF